MQHGNPYVGTLKHKMKLSLPKLRQFSKTEKRSTHHRFLLLFKKSSQNKFQTEWQHQFVELRRQTGQQKGYSTVPTCDSTAPLHLTGSSTGHELWSHLVRSSCAFCMLETFSSISNVYSLKSLGCATVERCFSKAAFMTANEA